MLAGVNAGPCCTYRNVEIYFGNIKKEEDDLEPKIKYLMKTFMQERVRIIFPTQEEFRSAAYCAKKKGIPVAPRRLEDLDFSVLNTDSRNMENYI